MNFFLLLITLISTDFSNKSYSIYGDWISIDTEMNLFIRISDSNEILFEVYPKKENSLYPQRFEFLRKDNYIILMNDSKQKDTINIIALSNDELEISFLPDKSIMKFYKFKSSKDKFEQKKKFELGDFFVSNYRSENSLDTILIESNIQYRLHNNSICEYPNHDSISYYKIEDVLMLQVKFDKKNIDIFIEEFDKDYVRGVVFIEGIKKKISIQNLNSNINVPPTISKEKIIGNWVVFHEEKQFRENLEKENDVIYIGHTTLKFNSNSNVEIYERSENGTEFWELQGIVGNTFIAIGKGKYKSLLQIVEISEKHLLLKYLRTCDFMKSEDIDAYLIKK